jgi:hypothetical protein
MSKARSFVCIGKDCCRAKGHHELLTAACAAGEVVAVRCQSICDGPVAGVEVDGRLEWFEDLRRPKTHAAVAGLVRHPRGPLPDRLRKRRVRKRSGRLR